MSDAKGPRGRRLTVGASTGVLLSMAALALAAPAFAQEAQPEDGAADSEEIVITGGFRGSLANALEIKRNEVGAVDAIVAEDIADFPDTNLAEALSRAGPVSVDRDAGEGRQIAVRGLDAQFTRVRINGMESLSTTGATDSSSAAGNVGSGTNRSRGFDFNVFAADLFNNILLRKTAQAAVEEGSLGATVDMTTARPFDYSDFTLALSAQAGYNDLSEAYNPRATFLVADRFAGGDLGVLFSVAYSHRELLEEGSSTVRWQNNGGSAGNNFGSLGPGYPGSGSTATLAEINGAFHPRLPRYDILEHEQDRLGATLSLQYRPTDSIELTLDTLYAKLDATRYEFFLEAPVFSAGGATGLNEMIVNAAEIDSTNTLVYGAFDNVDVRTEARFDELSTEFHQVTLNAEFDLTEQIRLRALAGRAESDFQNPIQTTLTLDAANVDGYVYDYRANDRLPLITYGNLAVNDPNAWRLTQIRLRPQSALNVFTTAIADLEFDLNEALTLRGGVSWKRYEFDTKDFRRSNGTTSNREGVIPAALQSAVLPFSNYSTRVSLHGGLDYPSGTVLNWLVPNLQQAASLMSLYDQTAHGGAFRLGVEPALNNNRAVEEDDTGAFLQLEIDLFDGMLRGDVGVRYVETQQHSSGFANEGALPAPVSADRTYEDTLPSFNLAFRPVDDLIFRFGMAKVMARPNIAFLTPGATVSVSGANRTVAIGNPELDPFRATTLDLGAEWYFGDEGLLSIGYFWKDIETFVQNVSNTRPFTGNPFGLDDSLAIAACGSPPIAGCSPAADWVFTLADNTPGGELSGFEIGYQQTFTFLPAPFNDLGVILNYLHVDSEIEYLDPAASSGIRNETLIGLSPDAYSGTIYYENDFLSARVSASHRERYLNNVPGRNGNTVEGKNATLNVDASAAFIVNEKLRFTLEGVNLTDEVNDQFVDDADRMFVYHHTGREIYLGLRYRY